MASPTAVVDHSDGYSARYLYRRYRDAVDWIRRDRAAGSYAAAIEALLMTLLTLLSAVV